MSSTLETRSNSTLESLGPDDKKKLEKFLEAAVRQYQEMDDIRGSLKDTAKNLAEELSIKPKHLMSAARIAFKNDLSSKQEDMDTVVDILDITGRG